MQLRYRPILLFLFALVLFGATPHATPAGDVTPMQQLYMMKELKPDVERVGIIWNTNSPNKEVLLPKIQRAATSLSIKIFLAEVSEVQDVAPRFRDLARKREIQVLWIVEDDGVVNQSVVQEFLIKNATKSLIPLMAPSDTWVNAGATLTLKKGDSGIQLVVNKAAVDAMNLAIPAKYQETTEFLAAN